MNKIRGVLDEEEKLGNIIPSIDGERLGKFRRELAVELRLVKVYELVLKRGINHVLILRDGTYLTGIEYREVPPRELLLARATVTLDSTRHEETLLVELDSPYISLLSQLIAITYPLILEKLERKGLGRCLIKYPSYCLKNYNIEELKKNGRLDLRLIYLYEPPDSTTLLEESIDVELRLVKIFRGWILEPEKHYILECERVTIPNNILPIDHSPRSSFLRCGWILETANIDVGFRGRIMLYLTALRNAPRLVLEEGARISQVRFLELENPVEGYSSQWSEK